MSAGFRVAGVMGWPVAHSLSPVIHRFWLDAAGVDGDYVRLPVRPEALGAALRALPALGFSGVNLTVPHKVAALAHLDRLEEGARRVGAANIVTVGADGSLAGDNSDVAGAAEALAQVGAGPGRPAAVLGSGGAARAALAALAGLGVEEVRLVARDAERAGALAQALAPGARLFALEAAGEAFAGALVVNATSLGMRGGPAVPEALLAALEAAAGLFDMVYAPLETPFLVRARALGLPAVDGLVMLVGQAAAAFAAFFGLDPVRERDGELRALLAGVA
ncbi:shikimate dehydrogenase [Thermaurantiacus tibetensis]|uniref:shikimate dehydrogenase n=1 Tax=Thermaurantiacus tibetensis TaxID=2759035 RepID=UPI002E27CDCE|nr:shikimate dehydrogenase [Thermaurantiacus tibetensis]